MTLYGGLSRWPPGSTGGSGGGSSDYAKQVDLVSDTVCYVGEAVPGSDVSDSVWRIRRITQTPESGWGDDITIDWAESDNEFDKSWDSRLSYVYG